MTDLGVDHVIDFCAYANKKGQESEAVGMVKKEHWRFEHEWRARFTAFGYKYDIDKAERSKYLNGKDYPYEANEGKFVDIELTSEAFDNIQIMIGPKNKEENKLIVESLLQIHLDKKLRKRKGNDRRIRMSRYEYSEESKTSLLEEE